MAEVYTPSEYAVGMLDEFKKDYQKMKERCVLFEQEHEGFCRRLGLNQDDFDTEKHPDHPEPKAFQLAKLSDRDQHMLSGYLADREKMYILEQCVRNIPEEDVRSMAEAYYLERKTQPEIAAKMAAPKAMCLKNWIGLRKEPWPRQLTAIWRGSTAFLAAKAVSGPENGKRDICSIRTPSMGSSICLTCQKHRG